MTRSCLALLLVLLLVSCSDEGTNTAGDCVGSAAAQDAACQLVLPTGDPKVAGGQADYSCLGKVTPPAQPDKTLLIKGKTQERLSTGKDQQKGEVTVELWLDQGSLSDATRAAKTKSDSDGNFELEVKVDQWKKATDKGPRVAWRLSTADSSKDTLTTVEFNDLLYQDIKELKADTKDPTRLVLEGADRITVSQSTLKAIEALLGVVHDKKQGIVLGVVRDCKRQEVANVSAGQVDSAGKSVTGHKLYFFFGKSPATRDQQSFTSEDGMFALINVAPTDSADVRVIGAVGGKQTVLSRQVIPVKADHLVIADFDPLPEALK